MTNPQLLQAAREILASKTAATSPQEMGVDPATAGQDPSAAGGAPPPGAPPMDPAMGMPPGPPPTMEQLAEQGDPMAVFMLDLKKGQERILQALGTIMDSAGIKMTASTAIQQGLDVSAAESAAPKQASVVADDGESYQGEVLDDGDGDEEDVELEPPVPEPPKSQEAVILEQAGFVTSPKRASLGVAASPGEGGAHVVRTKLTPLAEGNTAAIADHLKRTRAN